MPGSQGRMSGTPPPRSSPRRSHSSLTACPGPRRAGHGQWQGGDAPSARAASLASSAALPVPAPSVHRGRGVDPYVIPYVNPYVIPYALGVRTPGFAGRAHQCWPVPLRGASQPQKPRLTGPPRGSGAAAPQGALRAIDSSARPRLLAGLRPAPPSAAISTRLAATQGDRARPRLGQLSRAVSSDRLSSPSPG
jgi:hypothetical protein